MRKISFVVVYLAAIMFGNIFICTAPVAASPINGYVIRVIDGDTLIILADGNSQVKVRLSEIDAPEQGQAFGQKSKQTLITICAGKEAILRATKKDKYGRTLARVFCDDIDANSTMIGLGMAWVYNQYAKDASLYVLQDTAKADRVGLWVDDNPVPPWVYRAQKRH